MKQNEITKTATKRSNNSRKQTEIANDLGLATPFFTLTSSSAVIPGSRLSKRKRNNEENVTSHAPLFNIKKLLVKRDKPRKKFRSNMKISQKNTEKLRKQQ